MGMTASDSDGINCNTADNVGLARKIDMNFTCIKLTRYLFIGYGFKPVQVKESGRQRKKLQKKK
jgi:hypothetical protein